MDIVNDSANINFKSTDGNRVDILRVEGQTKKVVVGDILSSNSTEFESDGTVKFNGGATVYNDIIAPVASGRVSAVNQPTWTAFTTNTSAYTFAINDYIDLGTVEIPHSYKNGSPIEIHIHGASNGNDTTDRTIAFQIFYTYAIFPSSGSATFTTESSVTSSYTISANSGDKKAFYISVGTITDANMTFGTQFKMRIKRVSTAGTPPTNNPFLGQVGIHYESDTIGSRTINTK